MKSLTRRASQPAASHARKYPVIASALVALCTAGIARADLVTTTGNATGCATVYSSGPRTGANGLNYFNVEGDGNGTSASYGVLDFNTTSFLSFGVTNVSSLTLSLTESNAAFSHAGSVEVWLASDPSATIIAGAGNYTIPTYATGLNPEGIGSAPVLNNNNTVPAFGTLTDLGAIVFPTTGNVNNTTPDFLSLSSLTPAMSAFLANDLNTNGTVRFVLTCNSTDTSATWAGMNFNTASSRPSLTLTYTGSVVTYVTLLWTGTTGTWETAASAWQTTSSTYTNWSNPSGSITTASFNTATPLAVDAGGINVRALTFLTGTDGMVLNGSGKVTMFQGNISVATGSHVTIAAQISGSVGINLTGGGYLTLTNLNNDFTGPVTITKGTLYVADTGMASLGNATNPIYLSGGSLVLTAAQPIISRNLLVTGANTLDTGTYGDMTFHAYITNGGSGTLTRTGTGVLSFDLSDANPPGYFNSGTLIIAQGKVQITNADGGYTALGSGTAVVNNGATFAFADILGGGGLNVRNAPNVTLNAGGSLTATGGITTLSTNTVKISTVAGSPVVINSGVAGDTFVINSALRDSATGGSAAVLHVIGSGLLQMASGAISAASKPSSPAFSGRWDVSLDSTGILAFGPINYGGTGEVLNSPGYPAPAVNSTSNNYSGVTSPITVNSGTVAFGADAVNPNQTQSAMTVVSFRSPLTLNGGNIASTSYEYSDVFPNAGPGSSTPVTANLGADITLAAGKTSTVLLYDPIAGASSGGRSLNIMTDPNAVTSGTPVSTNLTWGANSTLVVDATGVSYNFGALSFTRNSGTVTVAAGATLQINPDATVNLGGAQDALNGGAHQVNVVNNGLLQISGNSNKSLGTLTGAGTITQAGTGTTTLSSYQGAGALNVNAGKLSFTETTGARRSSAITLKPSTVTVTNAGSALDISNHDMLVTNLNAGSYGTLQTLVMNGIANLGLGNGDPAGPQITSSSANNNPNASTFILPYSIDNTFGGGSTGDGSGIGFSDPNYTNGIAVTKPGTAFVKYLYFGDLNLDGVVNAADIFQEVGNVGLTTPGLADYGTSYLNGDLLGSGSVTTADIFLVVGSLGFGSGGPNNGPLGGLDGGSLGIAATGSASAATPEPASLALLGLGTVGLLIRRKRRTN